MFLSPKYFNSFSFFENYSPIFPIYWTRFHRQHSHFRGLYFIALYECFAVFRVVCFFFNFQWKESIIEDLYHCTVVCYPVCSSMYALSLFSFNPLQNISGEFVSKQSFRLFCNFRKVLYFERYTKAMRMELKTSCLEISVLSLKFLF